MRMRCLGLIVVLAGASAVAQSAAAEASVGEARQERTDSAQQGPVARSEPEAPPLELPAGHASAKGEAAPTPDGRPPRSGRALGAVLLGVGGAAVTAGYLAGAIVAGDEPPGGTLATLGGVLSGGIAGAFVGLWVNWRRKEPSSLLDYVLAPLVGGVVGAVAGGVLAGIAGTPPGTGRTVTHLVVASFLFCETAGLVAVRLVD
jgi:hypothetical protein